jgi:hypothetical protein
MSDPLVERWSGVLKGLAQSEREDLVRDNIALRARVAELEAALAKVRPEIESLREGVEDMHWYAARSAMARALEAIDAALEAKP